MAKYLLTWSKKSIPVWNTDFLASNNFFHTLLNSCGVFHRAGFSHSPGFIQQDFSIHRDFFFPLAGFFISFDLNLWSLFKIRRFLKKWLEDFFYFSQKIIKSTPQSIIGSLGWWTISFLPPFEGNNDTLLHP